MKKQNISSKKYRALLALSFIALFILVGGITYALLAHNSKKISTYKECVEANNTVLETYPEQCLLPDGTSFTNPETPPGAQATFEGKVICLKHKDTEGPQTLECAAGLETSDGKNYSLKSTDGKKSFNLSAGSNQTVKISGTLRPIADTIYVTEGIITVDSFEFTKTR